MNQAVEVSSTLLNRLPHLIVAIEIENIGDEIERVLVVLHLSIQACKVEAVGQVILVDLAEVLIAAR